MRHEAKFYEASVYSCMSVFSGGLGARPYQNGIIMNMKLGGALGQGQLQLASNYALDIYMYKSLRMHTCFIHIFHVNKN